MTNNTIIIIGHLGRDPEMRYIPSGTAVCSFSVATTEKRKDRSGEAQDITTWFKVTVWGRQAEACSQYLKKGSLAYIVGRLRQEQWTDREGQTRYNLEVNAQEVLFMSRKGEGSGDEAPASPADKQAKRSALQTEDDDNDIPF